MSKVCSGISQTWNQAFRKIVGEKTIPAHGSASVCLLEVEIERELDSHDRERER